jgi:uncharacterized protein
VTVTDRKKEVIKFKGFSEALDANTLLKHKVLFGSDFPLLTPDRWLADFEQIAIKPEVRPLILKENAVKLLRLDTQ